jgi:hypothetical protein
MSSDYFSTTVQETTELGQGFIQKAYNPEKDEYSVLYRQHGRYSQPVELSDGINNERDAEQLILAAEENGITELLEPSNEVKQ